MRIMIAALGAVMIAGAADAADCRMELRHSNLISGTQWVLFVKDPATGWNFWFKGIGERAARAYAAAHGTDGSDAQRRLVQPKRVRIEGTVSGGNGMDDPRIATLRLTR